MHAWTADSEGLGQIAIDYVLERLRLPKDAHWGAHFVENLRAQIDGSVTERGRGTREGFRLFSEVVVPGCRPMDSPMMLSHVPTAPTPAAKVVDMLLGATAIFAAHWEAGAGAIAAENEALRWIARCVGLPTGAGGCFVSGGSAVNLAALVAARHQWRAAHGRQPGQLQFAASDLAHSSVRAAGNVMDVGVLPIASDPSGRMRPDDLREKLAERDGSTVFAVVATAGTTSTGCVDDLSAIAEICAEHGLWMHVDGAYGGAVVASPTARQRLAGVEQADSFGVDPHKWLFAPYDCAALLYRDPVLAAAAHSQRAEYLRSVDEGDWNPSDFAFHLSRRARGVPLWFSLVVHGTIAYGEAIDQTLRLADGVARGVESRAGALELVMEPDLSIVLFRRRGWVRADYERWSATAAAAGRVLIQPFDWAGESCFRLCIVNPLTDGGELEAMLDAIAAA